VTPVAEAGESGTYLGRAPLSRRAVMFLLVLLVHVLIAVLGLLLSPPHIPPPKPPGEAYMTMLPPMAEPRKVPAAAPKAQRSSGKPVARKPTKPITTPKREKNPTPPSLTGLIAGAETFDLAKVAPTELAESKAGEGETGVDTGQDAHTVYGPVQGGSTGPHGEPLYPAEWYREPTHAELNGYLKNGAPEGSWAIIACRTVEQYRVEDCIELEQNPPGSGLSGALRQAAWQFRVRPPRVGGKLLVGAWVRIRIDFTVSGIK
jgi:hypothetical protein